MWQASRERFTLPITTATRPSKEASQAPGAGAQACLAALPLSAGTSAAGLISLYTSELLPIKLFGLYTAIGVLATLFLLFLFLPAWMQLWPMKPHSLLDGDAPREEDLALPARWRVFLEGVLARHHWVFVGLGALMVFCAVGLTKLNTTIKLTKMFSPHAEIIHNYEWLETKLGPLVPMEIVLTIDNNKCHLTMLERMQLVSRIQDRLNQIHDIGNTMSAVTFAMPLEIKRAGPFINKRMMAGILNKKLMEHRDEYLESGFLTVDGDKEMWRISARVGALNDIDYGKFIHDIRLEVDPVIAAQRAELTAADQLAAAAKATTTSSAGSSAAGPMNKKTPAEKSSVEAKAAPGVLAAIGVETTIPGAKKPTGVVPGNAPAANAVTAVDDHGIRAVYTGLVPVVYKAQRAMLDGLAANFITDLLTIAAVMTVVFWDLSAVLILLVPSVFPVIIVFGLMGWMGVAIDVGTIMTPTVALGVSVDDVVHFLIWYRRGLAEGRGRRGAIMLAYEGCARAMYQSWSVLGLGLAVFALSSFVPTQRFGAMMFCLLTAALVGNLLMMPAVLASPLAYFFGRRLVRRAERQRIIDETTAPTGVVSDAAVVDPPAPHHLRQDAHHRSART